MKSVLIAFVVVLGGLSAAHGDEKTRKPPKRAETPFTVFVDAHPKGDEDAVESIFEARKELEKKLRKNKKWISPSESTDTADVLVDLEAYWVREETRIHDQRHVAGGNSHTMQVTEIYGNHSLRSTTTIVGVPREMTGSKLKRGKGSAKDAADDLAKRLERYVKENYWELEERRQALGK